MMSMRLACVILLATSAHAITVDYPTQGSLFPPDIAAPEFLWRDAAKGVTRWRIDIAFSGGAPAMKIWTRGPLLKIGEIDPDCVADTNQPPRLTPKQAASHTWTPDAATWENIKHHSVETPAQVRFTGFAGDVVISRGQVTISTSRDPVGAPIFFRDVPLMPSETEAGVIKPLAAYAQRLIAWRLRYVGETKSRLLMDNQPMCANCHSFSDDGKTLGMDLDGLKNNKGMYALATVAPKTEVKRENVIQWSTKEGPIKGFLRVGFMSRVSPDGSYVVTTTNPEEATQQAPSNYYVANFKDYRFLQVFYPARGILSWYSRETGVLTPLPGADDPQLVQTNAVWSPDGKYLVFARAVARDPNQRDVPMAKFANDPNELPMRYDLYRIPFNNGRGGKAEPIAGASADGFSNAFPKVSPDGRWIIFVRCKNGLLMRPDSKLYVVPAEGGEARPLNANLPTMNSWHSFSPNGRWLVFSSKARSPYTQMYLTHIDEQGRDTPAILIDHTTAANRAVNIPEFVNVGPEGFESLGGPVLEYYRVFDRAMYFQKQGRYAESAAKWREAIALEPEDDLAEANLGMVLMLSGQRPEAEEHLRKAKEIRARKSGSAAN